MFTSVGTRTHDHAYDRRSPYQLNHRGILSSFSFLGIIIVLALSTLTPYFFFIPKASLSAVIICAVIFMIEYEVVKPMWKSSKKDLIPTVVTFVLCLLIGVEYGILVGVAINIMILIYPSARPSMRIEKSSVSILRYNNNNNNNNWLIDWLIN